VEDVTWAFRLLEATLLKKSDELTDACRSFFERLKTYLKEKKEESFYSKGIRSALRLTPSRLGRYLYELERMGYISIVRGNRYKGFEYKVNLWNDLSLLQSGSRKLVAEILEKIQGEMRKEDAHLSDSVSCIPGVTQEADGLPKAKKIRRKEAVTQTA